MKAKRLRVAAVQMRFAPEIATNLETMDRLLAEARRKRVDAVLFPECATTGYRYNFARLSPKDARAAVEELGGMAARYKINVLAGAPLFRRKKLYNTLVVFNRRGELVHCYAKCQLTDLDRRHFTRGNAVALFQIDGIWATAIICHERRYPELVRLAAMAGAQILFHPNAGLDSLAVSRKKRNGHDGIPVRAFENAIHYVFANSFGPQGGGLWSAGDSKIVSANGEFLNLAKHDKETVVVADLDLSLATRRYARESMEHPRFLAEEWKRMIKLVKKRASRQAKKFLAGI